MFPKIAIAAAALSIMPLGPSAQATAPAMSARPHRAWIDAHNKLFGSMDANGDGYLSESEYVSFLTKMANISPAEARRQFLSLAGPDHRMTLAELSGQAPGAANAAQARSFKRAEANEARPKPRFAEGGPASKAR